MLVEDGRPEGPPGEWEDVLVRFFEFGSLTGLFLLALLGLLILGLIVALIVVLVLRSSRGAAGLEDASAGRPGTGGSSTARAILEERYARGEIETAEFEERLRALGG